MMTNTQSLLSMNFVPSRKVRGFSLIELMITVAVIGILSAIAYPSYQNYVKRSNRAVAKTFIQTVANKAEQILPDQRAYPTTTTNADLTTAPWALSLPTEITKFYTVTVANNGGNVRTYTITATPVAGTMMASDSPLTLDNTGAKSSNWNQ